MNWEVSQQSAPPRRKARRKSNMADSEHMVEGLGLSDIALQAIIDGVTAKLQEARHKDGTPHSNGDPSGGGEGSFSPPVASKSGESELIGRPAYSRCWASWLAVQVVGRLIGSMGWPKSVANSCACRGPVV